MHIYTDGSKTKQGSGYGIYSRFFNLNIKWTVSNSASVVQTEVTGILIAANNITSKNMLIYTDSRQALLTLNRPRIYSGLVLECHEALAEVSIKNVVTLRWIKGHATSKGNRLADSLAKKAANQILFEPGPSIGLTKSVVTDLIKEHSLVKFKER